MALHAPLRAVPLGAWALLLGLPLAAFGLVEMRWAFLGVGGVLCALGVAHLRGGWRRRGRVR